ncbi:MAG: T9SS type A sorting domain-containing protein [Bacteroidales bacterium]|nr:T9SS type A sorting domain-containing protein [Bacteroidales bacterium]
MKKLLSIFLVILPLLSVAQFAPPAGQEGSTAIDADDPLFVAWATGCTVERGPMRIDKPQNGLASYGVEADALGKADDTLLVSLGDGGKAILTFESPICNGPGPDFAVFENPLKWAVDTNLYFLELAFVEVSSDGANFVRFPAYSYIPTETQVGTFACTDPKMIHNLAGKYMPHYGTPFELDDLPETPGLDKDNITHVRIVDVVGCINPEYATYDCEGRIINDPWPTPFNSSGFDLDAVGVIHDLAHSMTTTYHVTVTCNPEEGEVVGEGDYLEGSNITITAIPRSGYRFKSWNDGVTDNPRLFTVMSDITLIALFEGTGVDEFGHRSLTLCPNPVRDLLSVQGGEVQSMCVYSVDGQLMKTSETLSVDLSDLAPGLYLVRMVAEGKTMVKRIIKQ